MYLAERGGFEPPSGYYPEHAFQACDLNHSSISPGSGEEYNISTPKASLAPLHAQGVLPLLFGLHWV